MTRRVVITGLGTVNSLCSDVPGLWRALLAGKSGVGTIEQFDTSAFKVHFGGEVKDFHPETLVDSKTARRLDRFAQFALVASLSAVKDSGLEFGREDPTAAASSSAAASADSTSSRSNTAVTASRGRAGSARSSFPR